MLNHDEFIKGDAGITTIEVTLLLPLLFVILAMTYEVLKFQNDIAMVYFNEEFATQHVDLALLNNQSSKIKLNFIDDLNNNNNSFYFNSLKYSDLTILCYDNIDTKYSRACSKNTKLIKINYIVRRMYTSDITNKIVSLPRILHREVFITNDYYD